MKDFSEYKFRASSIARIMPAAKGNQVLSEGAKTFLQEIYADSIFGETPDVETVATKKGKAMENDAIRLLSKVDGKFYDKHDENVTLENDYVCGHPDIDDKDEETIIDIKVPFYVRKWFGYTHKQAVKNYKYQMQAYMWLRDYKTSVIAVCAMQTPDDLIFDDARKMGMYRKAEELPEEKYQEWEQKLMNLHNISVIPETDRIKKFIVERDDVLIDSMKSKIKAAREELIKMAEADNLSSAVQRTADVSFVNTIANKDKMTAVERIMSKYNEFGIELRHDETIHGASIDQMRFTPLKQGIKIDKAAKYNPDIQAVLESNSVIIETPIPNTGQIGIYTARKDRQPVYLPETDTTSNLVVSVGQAIDGEDYQLDIAGAPHILIGGTTGSGKSVLMNGIVEQLREKGIDYSILDPKNEFEHSHTEPEEILTVLEEAVNTINSRKDDRGTDHPPLVLILDEMETLLSQNEQREYEIDTDKYPMFITSERELASGKMSSKQIKNPAYEEELRKRRKQPKVGDACRSAIEFITRMGRSEKVHMICATQNPTVKNVSSSIKANCSTRICLRVASNINSRVILDADGGESLLGKGDMLVLDPRVQGLQRLQGYLIK